MGAEEAGPFILFEAGSLTKAASFLLCRLCETGFDSPEEVRRYNKGGIMEITLGSVVKGCLGVLVVYGTFEWIRGSIESEVKREAQQNLFRHLADHPELREVLMRELKAARKRGDL